MTELPLPKSSQLVEANYPNMDIIIITLISGSKAVVGVVAYANTASYFLF